MTRPPGRELDGVIHEQVMGDHGTDAPQYSTAIAEAWTVVEHLHAQHWQFTIELYEGEPACGGFFRSRDEDGEVQACFASAQSVPHVICLAALRAVGVVDLSEVR